MNIQLIKASDKFQLTEDFTIVYTKWNGEKTNEVFRKGLVLTLSNYTSHYQGTSVKFKTIYAKPIIANCYTGFNPEDYFMRPKSKTQRKFILYNMTQISELFSKLQPFNEEYIRITCAYTKTQ